MTTYSKRDFYTLYRGWNNRISCYIAGRFTQITDKKLETMSNVVLDINGVSFKVSHNTVTRL